MSWPEHKIFNVTFSEEEIAELYEKEWGFWSRVQQGIEPPVDSTKGCEQALRRQWPRVIDTEDMAQSDETVDKTLLLMGKNKEEMKKLRDEESRLKNIIRQKMEDRPLLVHPEGYTVASYKEDKNGNRVLRIVK
jgi:hypothetical protein